MNIIKIFKSSLF